MPNATFIKSAIYTRSDLRVKSSMIGSRSRAIQQYSPPSEWIMCELGVFPIFLENDLSKLDEILGMTFFKSRKDFQGFKTASSHLLLMFLFARWNVRSQPLFIRVEEAVL